MDDLLSAPGATDALRVPAVTDALREARCSSPARTEVLRWLKLGDALPGAMLFDLILFDLMLFDL